MKSEIDKTGLPINHVFFNFAKSERKTYINAPDEITPEGDDLIQFKKICKINNKDLDTVLKYCSSMEYAYARNFERVELLEAGKALASSVEKAKLNKKFPTWLREILIAVISSVLTAIVLTFLQKYWGING